MAPINRKKPSSSKKTKANCRECKGFVISEDEDSVECSDCKTWIHFQCSTLNKKQIKKIIDDVDTVYKCHFCERKTSTDDTLQVLLKKIDELTSTVKFLSTQYDSFFKEMKGQSTQIKALQKENLHLKSTLKTVMDDQRMLFSEVNRNKIIIKGMKSTSADVTGVANCVADMAIKGGSRVTGNDIVDIKVLSTKRKQTSSPNQTAIVTFSSFAKKLDFVTKRKTIRQQDCYKDVSISDLLSKASQQLFTHALSLRKVGFMTVYHQNGVIYAKKSMGGAAVIIRSLDHVDSLLRKSITTEQPDADDDDAESSEDESG